MGSTMSCASCSESKRAGGIWEFRRGNLIVESLALREAGDRLLQTLLPRLGALRLRDRAPGPLPGGGAGGPGRGPALPPPSTRGQDPRVRGWGRVDEGVSGTRL